MIPFIGEQRLCPWCDGWTALEDKCRHCGMDALDTENMVKCPWDAQRAAGKKGCPACKGSGWVEELKRGD